MLQNLQETTCVGVFLNKVRLATLMKKDSGKGVSPMKFSKLLRAPFL